MEEKTKTPQQILEVIISQLKLLHNDTAVLCVDCQNGFTERCLSELPVEGTDENWIREVNAFLDLMKKNNFKIIASKDDHPENHESFKIWPPHCIKGTYGNQLFIDNYDHIILKGQDEDSDSYSAFYSDINKKIESGLDKILKDYKIKNLIILGLAGDVCVIATIEDALKRGYKIFPIKEYIKSVNKKDIKEICEEKFGKIIV